MPGVGTANSVTTPAVVIRPIWLPVRSLGKPEVAVRAGRDPAGRCRPWGRELGDDAGRRDPADLVAAVLGEPEVAVRARP